MNRITVDVSKETYDYLVSQKEQKGSSISFEANVLIEFTIRKRQREKKLPLQDDSKEVPV
jgi:hypothetical protein